MRMLLLGTAGSGKTRAVETFLQELQQVLQDKGMPLTFVRVAAPTGSAAFNIKFNATTMHRLIHWTTPGSFNDLKPEALARFQAAMEHTLMLVFDEISMVGRQMMGRVDARLQQASGGCVDYEDKLLGGLSLVAVGDPAQCEAIFDQQIYDTTPHKASSSGSRASILSNRGLHVYSSFDCVIVLTCCHRLRTIENPVTPEEHE